MRKLRKKLFRPVASPGAILEDGKLVASWRVKAKGSKSQITVEKFGRIALEDLKDEAQRVAALRGSGRVRARDRRLTATGRR
jgi:hypothetical protein